MLGPLPKLYRVLVTLTALVLFVGAGSWSAFKLSYPVPGTMGLGLGLAVGAVISYLLLHTPSATLQPHRVRRHHFD